MFCTIMTSIQRYRRFIKQTPTMRPTHNHPPAPILTTPQTGHRNDTNSDVGACDAVVVSPEGSVTGNEWDNHAESSSSADFTPFEQRSDRLFGVVVDDGRKGLQLPRPSEGRSSFFQQVRGAMPALRLAVVDVHLEVELRLVGWRIS